MSMYEQYVLPRLIHWACAQKEFARQRKRLVPSAQGTVLEIGIGSGLNLPFYDSRKVDRLWGLEPVDTLKQMARKQARALDFKVRFVGLSGEQIPLENNSIDTVVTTYTLCSIPDARNALKEMKRVLKPGGKLLFCEHGKSPEKRVFRWQNRLNPFWKKMAGGCHLNRAIPDMIKNSGLMLDRLEQGYNSSIKISGYHYLGSAKKR